MRNNGGVYMKIKGVVLAAGYGSRFLPVTKTIPKEMIPLLNRPAIDFIIEEMINSGIDEILIVTSNRKKSLENYYSRDIELENIFKMENAKEKLMAITPPDCKIMFIEQTEMRGTGHALLLAKDFIGNDAFIVAYPDDVVFGDTPLSRQLITCYQNTGCMVLATVHRPSHLERYGVIKVAPDGLHVEALIEKPALGTEPSEYASVGRYLYTPEIFELLQSELKSHEEISPRSEFHHVSSISILARQEKVVFEEVKGQRFDLGSPDSYLLGLLHFAETLPEMRVVLNQWREKTMGE